MDLHLLKCGAVRALTLTVVLMSSCTYHHWVKPDEVDIRPDETVYRLVTLDGDTVSFAGSEYIRTHRNRLTGVTRNEYIGHGGLFSEGAVSGVDSNGADLFFPEEDIYALEIPDRTAMVGTISIILVSIPATILVVGSLIGNGKERTTYPEPMFP